MSKTEILEELPKLTKTERDEIRLKLAKEFESLKSRIVTSSWGGARRALPYAFSEHGILMLSTVLRSPRAIQVNIAHHARVC